MKQAKADRIYWSVGSWSSRGRWMETGIFNSRIEARKFEKDENDADLIIRRIEGFFTEADR